MFIRPELSADSVEIWRQQVAALELGLAACERQWDAREIEVEQQTRLGRLIRFAFDHVRYYRRVWTAAGVTLDDVASAQDVRRLPVIGREEIQRHGEEMLPDDWQGLCSRWNRTSGSSGQPVRSLLGANHDLVFAAITMRARAAMSIPWGARVLQLVPRRFRLRAIQPPPYWMDLNGVMATWQCDPTNSDPDELLLLIERLRPDVILGNTHLLGLTAELAIVRGRTFAEPSWIINSFEPLTDDVAQQLQVCFPSARLEDIYGCSEVGDLAWRCSQGGYHVNTDFYLVELTQEGETVSLGCGEVTVTDLWNYAMPLVRYRTGDIAEWEESDCDCGRKLPRFKRLEGRTAPLLSLPDGESISSYAVMDALQLVGVAKYRVRQQAGLNLELFVPEPYDEAAQRGALALKKLAKGLLPVEVRPLDELETPALGPIVRER